MKQLLDFLPLLIFFFIYKNYDVYMATGALIAATAIQIGLSYLLYKTIEKMHLISFALIVIFGGLTMALQDDNFIKWKVTIVYLIFAAGLFIADRMGKPALKAMLGKEIQVDDQIWAKVNHAWVAYFVVLAGLNIYIAYNFSMDAWVNFKVFWLTGLTFAYTIATVVYLFKHMPKNKENN
ncbi:septation protein A [Paraferrimonas sp. SM1919]|uniref:septation protein A n=1 Tax=Paraferrimonas sp. SM1919 TaxID=2662263 RepID=UPI0013D7E990|nr:septation protein A [Paraferrimonas sp. SM1919]